MTLFIDMTDLVFHATRQSRVTGIQRVQMEVAKALLATFKDARAYSVLGGRYRDITALLNALNAQPGNVYDGLRKRFGHSDSAAMPPLTIAEKIGNLWQRYDLARRIPPFGHPPPLSSDDVIYAGGAFWADPNILRFYERAHRKGAHLIGFLHDVIPMTFPHFTDGGARPYFERFLRLPFHVITNSRFTRRDVAKALSSMGGTSPATLTDVVPLAHEFIGTARNQPAGPPPTARLAVLAGQSFALCVGSIEIRKNHLAMLDMWQALSDQLGPRVPKLIVAGRRGWQAQEAVRKLDAASFEAPYFLVEAPTDAELIWLYRSCHFTIFPSLIEGWGLPVGESLWFGKPCIASCAGSIPEVGGDLCLYADPHAMDGFSQAVKTLVTDASAHRAFSERIAAATLRRWHQVAAETTEIVSRHVVGAR